MSGRDEAAAAAAEAGEAETEVLSPTPQATLDHFNSIPWVASRLSDQTFRPVHLSRTLTHAGKGHTLMASTWNTPTTISHILSTYRPPLTTSNQKGEIRRFYTFGGGLNAHPNLLHGGVIATILDSTMGNVIGQELPAHGATYTVKLTVEYKRPVTTPGTVMARAWIVAIEGRKVWVEGVVEDGEGNVHARAEGMWLRAKGKANGKL
ncbi:hypothetical protein G647_01727 [Cladophialophora carrionii CBS 160.54]|uniref:Thioesterase domain-containing protein n=1 Tax=Cladophialophora carrionii CBS 160.54 TaxID=1279043 RepID=V9DQU3_9EURO|nr:uncharacterized protein G647_01727 [Cladophialophora carrionii CBS 160.54]ETI29274.1 hypothetical protein G647_01727 [Cladophialophora carrionii CBS 160.54]